MLQILEPSRYLTRYGFRGCGRLTGSNNTYADAKKASFMEVILRTVLLLDTALTAWYRLAISIVKYFGCQVSNSVDAAFSVPKKPRLAA